MELEIIDIKANETKDVPLFEKYKIIPELYENYRIKDINISSRIKNALSRSEINTLSDLLKCSISDLLKIRNLGNLAIKELIDFINNDLNKLPSIFNEKPDNEKAVIPSIIYKYKENITKGDFSFKNAKKYSQEELEIIGKYENAFSIVGNELVSMVRENPDEIIKVMNILSLLTLGLSNCIEQKDAIKSIVARIPLERMQKPASSFIKSYFYLNESISKKYQKLFYKDKLCTFDINIIVTNKDIFYTMSRFFEWCTFDLNNEIDNFVKKIYKHKNSQSIITMRTNCMTLGEISNQLKTSRQNIQQIETATIKIFHNEYQHFNELCRKISAEYNISDYKDVSQIFPYFKEQEKEINYIYNRFISIKNRQKNTPPKKIGEIIKYYREKYEYEIDEFSEKINIETEELVSIEQGIKLPSEDIVKRASEFFNVPTYIFKLSKEIRKLSLGEKIKYFRESKNIKESKLAKAVNVYCYEIKAYENNKKLPSYEILKKIADYLNINVDLLKLNKIILKLPRNELIKYYRHCKKMNQAELAQKTNIATRRISVLESGKCSPRITELIKISQALDIEPSVLGVKMTVGDKIKIQREKLKITLSELSQMTNISINRISGIENNKIKPKLNELYIFANVFNIQVDEIDKRAKVNLDNMKTSKKIKYYRALKGISQAELSKRANLSESMIWQVEKGKKNASHKALIRISQALDIELDKLK